jgi:LPXTG-motif cell wall-anchored protein
MRKIVLLLLVAVVVGAGDVMAQCAMCKAVVESNVDAGGSVGGGINNGIMYLMGVPYILIATAGFFIYRNYKKHSSETT